MDYFSGNEFSFYFKHFKFNIMISSSAGWAHTIKGFNDKLHSQKMKLFSK